MSQDIMNILPIAMIVIVGYFFLWRPQQKKMKEAKTFRENLSKGDEIITTGGIRARVVEVRDNNTVLVDAGKTQLVIEKDFLSPVGSPPPPK